ncbi:MAG: aminotransferase class V-fold PLP-dependent enzyme, partial [Eggerthellaceae bacterium]|nr:aminotransferase class V-fold PLP-dependent enzyme [Eggerthellaceae bacterium]
GTVPGGYDNVVIVNADNVRVTTDHLYEVCLDAFEHPEVDAVASWIQWLRRPPYVFSRKFLEGLEERGLTSAGANGRDRDVPRIAVLDHVFGEEKLAASLVANRIVEAFEAGCTITALEAVQLAKQAIAHPDEPLYSPNQPKSLMGPVEPRPLEGPDKMLVEIAKDVLASRAAYDAQEDIAWADAFAQRCRLDFPLLNDCAHAGKLAYLDTAATAQRVDAALQAQHDFDVHENANVYRGGYELSAQATFTFNDARAKLERFIGAERRQVVFTANTTGAINLVAQAWGEWNIGPDDRIVLLLADHHSATLPFIMLAQRKGAKVDYVPYTPDGRIDQQAYAAALEKKPKLVCIAHIGNVFGIEAPVKDMVSAAHEVGARVLVDAAQSFAHEKIDVKGMGADWVAISAHKAYGPMGIGALWISPEAFDEMDPLGGGGGTVSHVGVDSYYLRPKAIQYEMGTPPVSQAVGWAAAIGYLESIGIENVARHDAVLTRYLVEGLHRIDGVDVMGDHSRPDGQTGLVSFTLRSLVPASLAAFAGKLGVAMRSGGHCALPLHASMGLIGTGRLSLGVYTTLDDVDAALVAIEACRYVYEM